MNRLRIHIKCQAFFISEKLFNRMSSATILPGALGVKFPILSSVQERPSNNEISGALNYSQQNLTMLF